jgi:hypothetical protein
MSRDKERPTIGQKLVVVALSPLIIVLLLLVVIGLPFYWLYRLLLRLAVQVLWVARGKRILLVYSSSPVWQEYIEVKWLPRLRDHAVVLNWSERSRWHQSAPFAAWVFKHWAPSADFNPMAILFQSFPRTRRIGFYYAFRDWKHGNEAWLRTAEEQLFTFVSRLEGS